MLPELHVGAKYCSEECLTKGRAKGRASQKRQRENHPERALAKKRKWEQNNREKVQAGSRRRSARWLLNHPEAARDATRKYRQSHPEQRAVFNHRARVKRLARKLAASGTCSAEQLQARINYYGGCCYVCLLEGKHTPYEAIDHVIPLSKGGSNWPSNLRPICKRCNLRKGAKLLIEFLRRAA